MDAIIEPLHAIDWNDIGAVEDATSKALFALLDDRLVIRRALLDLPRRPDLLRLCEEYDIFAKVVLHDDASGVRVRLHVYRPGYFDEPHNHRWSFASVILRGQYRHHLFGNVDLDEHADPASLRAVMVRRELPGSSYALLHSMVHTVVAEPYTVSLVIRGPAVKDRFLVMDRGIGQSWWDYGGTQDSAQDAERKRITPRRLTELTAWLQDQDLF